MLSTVMKTLEIFDATDAAKFVEEGRVSKGARKRPCKRLPGRRSSPTNYLKVPTLYQIMIQALIIDHIGTSLSSDNAVSSSKLPNSILSLQWASSNHTSYIIDQDNVNSTSAPSKVNKLVKPGRLPESLKEITLDVGLDAYDDDEYDEDTKSGPANSEEADEEDDEEDEDEDDFYQTNPVDSIPPATSTDDGRFSDFDDFDALGLNDFYGDNRQSDKDEHTHAKKGLPHEASLSSGQTLPHRAASTKHVNAEPSPLQRPMMRRRRRRKKKTRPRRARRRKSSLMNDLAEQQEAIANKSLAGEQLGGNSLVAHEHNAPQPRLVEATRLTSSSELREQQASSTNSNLANTKRCAMIASISGACIDYASVEWALRQARRLIAFRRPGGLGSLEPSEATVHAIGELIEWASRLLAMRFGLTSDEVASSMDQIDVSQTSLWRVCPRLFRSPSARPCYNQELASARPNAALATLDPNQVALASGRYRSLTGQCNNPLIPNLGSSFMPFVRLNTPEYGDGIGSIRRAQQSLAELPPARLVSLVLHSSQADRPSNDLSAMLFAWGQLINHDLALASGARVATGHEESCCTAAATRLARASEPLGRVCMPIHLPATDPVYGPFELRCLDFKRSIAGLRPGCSLGPRTQMNLVSAFVDGSFVYGSTRTLGSNLRQSAAGRGQLAVWNYFARERVTDPITGLTVQRKPLLPPQLNEPDDECLGRRGGLYCFRSGDSRTNQQVPLVVLHTIHTRQHNRLAEALSVLNPHWTSERIFQEARHIHIAQIQHILMREYLPLILGAKTRSKFDLLEAPDGEYWDHYEPTLNAGISQEFAAAAFRQGHSTVASEIFRVDVLSRLPRQVYRLRDLFRQPWPLFELGAVDEFLLGLTESASREMDPFVSRELGGHLLQEPNEPVGLDLIAINIQRGRDQGVASYNSMRDWCGLSKLETVDDLAHEVGSQNAQLMMQLYESVDDIDLYSGGLSETPLESSGLLGPTFSCIVAHQFNLLRKGDRYWYESSGGAHAFTPEQLASIKETTLAQIVCANSDQIWSIQPLAMRLPHPIYNPPVRCQDLPDLDLSLWVEFAPVQQ